VHLGIDCGVIGLFEGRTRRHHAREDSSLHCQRVQRPGGYGVFTVLAEEGDPLFRTESASTAALEERPIAPNAVAALEEVRNYPRPHSARRISEVIVEEAELVLAMTPQHAATFRRLGSNPPGGIHALP
jgi:hypothetical protein